MRSAVVAALIVSTATALAACNAGGGGTVTPASGNVAPSAFRSIDATGPSIAKSGLKELVVSNYGQSGSGNLVVLNTAYSQTASIYAGLNESDGVWIDAKGRIYAANLGGSVTEYAANPSPSGAQPIFTYATPGTSPVVVTTDAKSNVYVGNGDSFPGSVYEYKQGSDTPLYSCVSSPGLVIGVAVDSKGDVFVANVSGPSASAIYEYPKGLKGCNAAQLPVPVNYVGGIALDKNDKLVIAEQTVGDVLIVPYPYSNVETTLLGFSGPYQLALDKKNDLLFVTEGSDVAVCQYPSGTRETTLGASQGVYDPTGVAAYPER
jgi:hypothetical protein